MAADRIFLHGGRGVTPADVERDILAATERLLAQVPISCLSVTQIVTEAGISRATFYYYFKSKFAVLAALLARLPEEIFLPFEALTHNVNRRDEAIQAWPGIARMIAEMWTKHRNLLRAVNEHWHAVAELRQQWLINVDRGAEIIASVIDVHREAGLAKPGIGSDRLASTLAWSIVPICYAADSEAEVDSADVTAALEPLLIMLATTLYGPD